MRIQKFLETETMMVVEIEDDKGVMLEKLYINLNIYKLSDVDGFIVDAIEALGA